MFLILDGKNHNEETLLSEYTFYTIIKVLFNLYVI